MSDVFCLEIGRFRSFMADIYKKGRISCEKCKFMQFSKPARIAYFEQRYCGSKSRVKWRSGNCTFFLNLNRDCPKKEERANQRDSAFLVRIELLNPNRSLDPEQISLYCCPVKVFLMIKIRLKPSCRISASFVTLLVGKKILVT